MDATKPFYDISELVQLVDRFERCSLPVAEWNHRAQLAVAGWYLIHFGEPDACRRMISGAREYNRRQGIRMTRSGGYHETLTLFWLAVSQRFLSNYPSSRVLVKINGLVRRYGRQTELHLEYYSRRRIMSWPARTSWVAPDLKAFRGCDPSDERLLHEDSGKP